ncbi:hypothetical protein ACLB1O_23655 [Escherichia coli]
MASACLWVASTLKISGPSVLLAYIIAGLFVFFIMRSMAVLLNALPVEVRRLCASLYEPVFRYRRRLVLLVYVDGRGDLRNHHQSVIPSSGSRRWRSRSALIAVALVALANLAAVRLYGEIEFWFAMIGNADHDYRDDCIGRGVIFFGFGNGGQSIGFSNLTEHGGFFAGGFGKGA